MHLHYRPGLLRLLRSAAIGLACAALSGLHAQTQNQPPPPRARILQGRQAWTSARSLDRARSQHLELLATPRAASLSAPWTPVGPAQVASQLYGPVTGRITSLVLDPEDATGNTVYFGSTGGGVWKSTNAAGPAASVTFQPLTDTLPVFSANAGTSVIPSLSIGALAMANGVLLAGTGDSNDATDSFYGSGILRSADGGATWTLAQQSTDGAAGNHSFFGLGVAALAFSSANPSLAVAALTASAEGTVVNAPDTGSAVKGLYYSTDAGLTWHMASLQDGSQTVQSPRLAGGNNGGNAATAVVWNPLRQRFYAAVQFHGYYESADGQTWTRLLHQPGAALTTASCPANTNLPGAAACPIFRGALAVQPVTGDTFALTTGSNHQDRSLVQDTCLLNGTTCASATPLFANTLDATPLEAGSGSTVIAQADDNLTLAAVPSGPDTLLFAGTDDLYRCTLTGGSASTCALRNTTNAANGCLNRAGVFPAQHALAALGSLLYIGNDGGLYRSTDAVAETGQSCNATDSGHFQNLNSGLGSLAEVAFLAQDPADPDILLAGLGTLGTAGTGSAATSAAWPQLATGEGGQVAIDPVAPANWYLSTNASVSVARCSKGVACTAADFTAVSTIGPAQVGNDVSAMDAAWRLDPAAPGNLLIGTCRAWRGPAGSPTLWSSANLLSQPFGASGANGCTSASPIVRSLAAGGPAAAGGSGSQVLYAGLAGALDGGQALPGHLFTTSASSIATSATVWADAAKNPVTNDLAGNNVFNPGGFDVSSLAVDPHDATGRTVYATVTGFPSNGVDAPHVYGSTDAGAHWLNLSSNLPAAPANSIVIDPNDANTLYVALDTGVYVTTQVSACASGNCWSVYGAGLPNAPAITLQASAAMPTGDGRLGELRAGTYGRGIWQIPLLTAVSPAVPAIALNPNALTFALQQAGTLSAAQTVTVTNTGTAPLIVSSVIASGDFLASDTCIGTPVPQGGTCTVNVRFQPTAAGTRTGQLTVSANISGGQAAAGLSGTGTPPATVVLTPTALTFPNTNLGSSSAVQNIILANTGGTVAALASFNVTGDFNMTANSCGAMLAPSTGCSVSLAFTPTVSGARSGTLTVVDDAGVQTASLSGTGITPATDTLSPATLAFQPQQLNTLGPAQQVTLVNAGDVPLTLISGQIGSGDFTATSSCGNSLAAHSSCTLSVAFAPKSLGAQTGSLIVSDQFRSQTVALSGVGLAPPGVSLAPANGLSFGAVTVGQTATGQTVTLTNNGGVPLVLAGIHVTGDFGLAANTCGSTLAPSAACTAGISFTPAAAGPRSGSITFTDNAANSPQSLALTGAGVDFTLAPSGPVSMSISTGQTAAYALLLSSAAGVPGNAVFTCSGVPAHTRCTVNPANAALGATTPITVTVTTGLASAALQPPTLPWSARPLAFAGVLALLAFRSRYRIPRVVAILLCMGLLAACGCSTPRTLPGSGASTPSTPVITPSGTYTLTVAASSAGLVRTVNLTLVVQ